MHRAIGSLFGSTARAIFDARAARVSERGDDDDDALDDEIAARGRSSVSGAKNARRASASASEGVQMTAVKVSEGRDGDWRTPSTVGEGRGETRRRASADAVGSSGKRSRRSTTPVKSTVVASKRGTGRVGTGRAIEGEGADEVLKEVGNAMSTGGASGEQDVASTVAPARASEGKTRKKGASTLPVKNIDFDAEDAANATPVANRVREQTTPSTSGRKIKATQGKGEALTNALSPNVGGVMGSPAIFNRVDDVVAGLGSDCYSESETETELEEEEDEEMGTQDDGEDYAGGTQVLDSAELCDVPSRFDLAVPPQKEEEEALCARGGDAAIRLLRRRLFGVNRERPIDADGLEFAPNLLAHRSHLLNILEDTVSGGQNNSVLIVGNRGSGKSLVLNSALKILESRHPGKLVAVHLSGLLHADERIGMQKIAAQLCPNLNGDSSAYATGGFSENVAFMNEMLKLLQGGQRGVIFVLDDFELFAMRSKQTLLYAITDLLQQPHVQAAVVGVTCRHSVDRLLEKRVASRFSNRRIVIAPPANTTCMVDGITKALKLSEKDKYLCPSEPDYVQQWNLHLRASMQSSVVQEKLEQYGRLENTPASVSKLACAILSRVNRQLGKITSSDIVEAVDSLHRNPFVDSLVGSTPLELLLCVAMYRMHTARKRPSFTFEALAQELNDMGSREQLTHAKECTRPVLVRAFENLLTLGIATAHKSGSGVRGAALKEYKNIVFVVDPEELREAIRRHPNAVPVLADYMDHESLRQAHVV